MKYRLDELDHMALQAGLSSRRPTPSRLEIPIAPEVVLVFANLEDEGESLVAFDGTPWHSHGLVQFLTGPDTFLEYDELGVLSGLLAGELLVVSEYRFGQLSDRWIAHRLDGSDLQHLEAGDQLCFLRLSRRAGAPATSSDTSQVGGAE